MSSRRSQIERLHSAFDRNKLVLVLGSGISSPHGIPTWTALLKEMAEEVIDSGRFGWTDLNEALSNSPLILARYLATVASGRADFHEVLRRALYRRFAYNSTDGNLKAIVSLLAESVRRPGDRIVLTYNFDDLLEQALERYGAAIPYLTIGPDERIESSAPLAIVHCHGCIPQNGAVSGTQVVFDEIQYNRQYNSRMNTIDVMQSYCFSQMVCLFLGTSLVDPNARRLLDGARAGDEPRHFIVRRSPDNPAYTDVLEKDAYSLGVETIWISDYAQISDILKSIDS